MLRLQHMETRWATGVMSDASRSERLSQARGQVIATLQRLAHPKYLARVQQIALLLLLVWGVQGAARLVWALWPNSSIEAPATALINPISSVAVVSESVAVDVASLLGLGLFGDPIPEAVLAETSAAAENPREGIEQGARETRLDLTLAGIVASTEDGLGTAIIESKSSQSNYAVGDTLPVAGSVTVAKVMPTQVVLDNNGTYELLVLFEQSLAGSLVSVPRAINGAPRQSGGAQRANVSGYSAQVRVDSAESARLAAQYREQLYDNPQSLAELVTVSAVRDDAGLRGYRIAPGRNSEQFRSLGFQAGDIVTAVNGMALSDPANTLRLYQIMRDATSATFDVERQGTSVTISVSLGDL